MNQAKILLYGDEGRARLKRGIDALVNMVKVTLGPKGRNVVIDRQYGGPLITKDGVTVARQVFMKDVVENMGAELVRQVASRTAEVAGDGTTTAAVLAQAIVQEGMKNVTSGANPMDVKRGIDLAVKAVVEKLDQIKIEVSTSEEVVQVGTISANNDIEIGKLLAQAMDVVGKEGIITVEDAKGIETSLEVVEGMQFDRGYLSHYFITDVEKMQCELTDALVLIYDSRISDPQFLVPFMTEAAANSKALLVIAEDIEGEALRLLVYNKIKGTIRCCAVKAPGFGDRRREIMDDLAVLTNGQVISTDLTLRADVSMLGQAGRATITRDSSMLVEGKGSKENIKSRILQIRNQIEKATSDYDKEKLQERLAKLSGGVAVLRVGAATEVELKERKDRIEDALHATRAAVEEGIVPGGGVAYLRCLSALTDVVGDNADQNIGIAIVQRALRLPAKCIAENAGVSGDVVVDAIMKETTNINMGYNAQTGEYVDMVKTGIVDPKKVARAALENAASIAALFLTTEGVISDDPVARAEFERMLEKTSAAQM